MRNRTWQLCGGLLAALCTHSVYAEAPIDLLNVSYDSTRELYAEIDQKFAKNWQSQTGQEVRIKQLHGGSGRQVNAVLNGTEADVVTLGSASDIDALAKGGKLIANDWRGRFPHDSVPFTSTSVMLVRKGNPKKIHDWGDLDKDGVRVITPDPRTSAGGRWNFLSLYAYGLNAHQSDNKQAIDFVTKVYDNVGVFDFSSRGAVTSFTLRQHGDVLITWENEALVAVDEHPDLYELVAPSISLAAQPAVASVDQNDKKHGTEKVSQEFLAYLFTPEAQAIAAKHYFRPTDRKIAYDNFGRFPHIHLVTIDELGGWAKLEPEFYWGGRFEPVYHNR